MNACVHPYAQLHISCMYIWAQQCFPLLISQNQHALLKYRRLKVKHTELQNVIAQSKIFQVWEQSWLSAGEASETQGTLDKKRRQVASLKASCSIQSYFPTATISYHLVIGQKKQANNSVKQKSLRLPRTQGGWQVCVSQQKVGISALSAGVRW